MTHPVPGDGDSKVLTRVPLTPGLQTEQPLPFRPQSLYRSGLGVTGHWNSPPTGDCCSTSTCSLSPALSCAAGTVFLGSLDQRTLGRSERLPVPHSSSAAALFPASAWPRAVLVWL